jgi:hypothetical protein
MDTFISPGDQRQQAIHSATESLKAGYNTRHFGYEITIDRESKAGLKKPMNPYAP